MSALLAAVSQPGSSTGGRCGECTSLLLLVRVGPGAPRPGQRSEPDPEVIAALAADTDLMVAGTARWQQDRLEAADGTSPVTLALASR